jgi:hypothetical protein
MLIIFTLWCAPFGQIVRSQAVIFWSPRRFGFDLRTVCVGCVVSNVVLGQFLCKYFGFFSCHTTPYNLSNPHWGRHARTALSNAIRAAMCCGVPGFISRPCTCYHFRYVTQFPWVFQVNSVTSPDLRPRPLPSKFITIRHSLIILPFAAKQTAVATAL